MSAILIICDENELALALKHVLRGDGHGTNIETVSSFCEAETLIHRISFDLVVVDGDMKPRCRTMQRASERIKRLRPRAKILFMTSDSDSTREASVSADAIIVKPFTSCDIIREAHHALAAN